MMRWHKRDANEHRKPHVVDLWQRHGLQGVFFWDHLNDLLTEYFDFWCPGCYEFRTTIFYAYFHPQIDDKQNRLIKKMLSFLNDEKIITSSSGRRLLYIYYPDIIERAKEYTRLSLERAKERGQEQPESARVRASECDLMHSYSASKVQGDARTFFENKRVKH